MHDAIQQRMREPAGEPAQECAEERDFAACCRRGGQRHDEPQEADERGVDDDEEEDGCDQPRHPCAEERVKEAMHGVFTADQVVDRLAVDDDLGRGEGGPREYRGGDALERQAGTEMKGRDRQRYTTP